MCLIVSPFQSGYSFINHEGPDPSCDFVDGWVTIDVDRSKLRPGQMTGNQRGRTYGFEQGDEVGGPWNPLQLARLNLLRLSKFTIWLLSFIQIVS